MAYQYKLTWTDIPDDMVEEETYNQDSVKKGDRLYCNTTLYQDDSYDAVFKRGKVYVSDEDGSLINEDGIQHHLGKWRKYFTPAPHPVEKCNCDKCEEVKEAMYTKVNPDRDYFQSIQEEYGADKPTGTEALITEECENLKNLLIEKNRRYGDSAINRGQIYDIPATVAIKARINDKLLRLKNLQDDESEDVVLDLLGYFILLRIATKKEEKEMVDSYASMFPGK